MNPVIDVRDVAKRFRLQADRPRSLKEALVGRRRLRRPSEDSGFWALRDVSFEVEAGESFGLIGHNGSGKSTLLRIIAGIYPPSAGSVTTSGRISALLELGSGFHPDLTGRENIFLNGAILGLSRRHVASLLDEIVEFSGLGRFIDEPVKVYSSGMYVRLGYAVAVHVEPEILLVDEVLAVGDEEFQRRCLEHMYGLRRSGVTIVVVSHAVATITSLCDRAVWLDHGDVRSAGAADAVAQEYLVHVNALEAARSRAPHDGDDAIDALHTGSGEVRLYAVHYLDENWGVASHLVTGEPAIVRLWYDAAESVEAQVVVDVHGERDELIISHATGLGNEPRAMTFERGQGYVDLRLPSMVLAPGSYYLSVRFSDASALHMYDRVERCAPFVVQSPAAASFRGLVSVPADFSAPSAQSLNLAARSLDARPAADVEPVDKGAAE